MCIALWSDVPIQIQFFQEQVWCIPSADEFTVKECYDIVFANHGTGQTTRLFLLSPHLLFDPTKDKGPDDIPAVKLPSFADKQTEFLNWYMKHDDPVMDGPFLGQLPVSFSVPVYPMPGEDPFFLEYKCTHVEGSVRFHSVLKEQAIWDAFLELECTVVEARLEQPVQPYDPARTEETTYCIRLVLEPHHLNHRVGVRRLSIAGADGSLWIQPCEVLSPPVVLQKFRARMKHLAEYDSARYKALKNSLVDNGFDHEDHIAWVEDHRVSIVTTESMSLANCESVGCAVFYAVQPAGTKDRHAWTWHGGARHYWQEDPFFVAENIYRYLLTRAKASDVGTTKQQIVNDVGFSMNKVSFVVDAFREAGFIIKDDGRYSLAEGATDKTLSYESQAAIRRIMAKPQKDWADEEIRFPGVGFMVQFALVWSDYDSSPGPVQHDAGASAEE